jgi:hypothetical protein
MNIKAFTRKHVAVAALAVSAAIALPLLTPAEASSPNYDGLWSVVIQTQQGLCEPSYRAPIRISKGTMVNAGSGSFTITGRVGKNGAVVVQVSQGPNSATGTGQLQNGRGGGSWSGGPCAGTWHAEKRA